MTAQNEWRAAVRLRRPQRVTHDDLAHITRALPGFGIVVDDRDALVVELTVNRPTLRLAVEAAIRDARKAYGTVYGSFGEATQVRVLPAADAEAEAAGPGDRPPVVGVAEIAELLAVSQQRASQITALPDFPEPLGRLKSGPVWLRTSVEVFHRGWTRRPGRQPRTADTDAA